MVKNINTNAISALSIGSFAQVASWFDYLAGPKIDDFGLWKSGNFLVDHFETIYETIEDFVLLKSIKLYDCNQNSATISYLADVPSNTSYAEFQFNGVLEATMSEVVPFSWTVC